MEMNDINNHINNEINVEQLRELDPESYRLLDVRDMSSYQYGAIPGAVNLAYEELKQMLEEDRCEELFGKCPELRQDNHKAVIVYCKQGQISEEAVELLQEHEINAVNLVGGYSAWLIDHMKQEDGVVPKNKKVLTRCGEIELSIRKKFHKQLFSRFAKGIRDYELVKPGDKIAVCISGGKDSMLMAKLFQELQRHHKFPFELVFLVMDPGYNKENRQMIEYNAKLMEIPITVFETDIFDAVFEIEKSPCYLCARMRRGHLYKKAQELGCNKIALGHHYDDVIETILMGMMYGAQIQTMMPKLHSTNFEGMELIRPMYLLREEDIKHWRDYNKLHFIQCACHFTDTCTTCSVDGSNSSKRMEIKYLIHQLKETNPFIESNIFRSVENVNLDTVIAYKQKGQQHHFLDEYDL